MAKGLCRDCTTFSTFHGRHLCRSCYHRRRRADTLDEVAPVAVRDGNGLADSPLDAGMSYRQLDYWVHQGYLNPGHARPGSGSWRSWPPTEVTVARLMYRLVTAGLTVRAAHQVARGGPDLAPGIRVVVDP